MSNLSRGLRIEVVRAVAYDMMKGDVRGGFQFDGRLDFVMWPAKVVVAVMTYGNLSGASRYVVEKCEVL